MAMTVVTDIAGTMLVSIFMAAILYGVTTTQTFLYYQNYPKDRPALKAVVAIVWLFETLHTAFCIDFIYNYVITNFGNTEALNDIYWSGGITVVLGVLVAGVVHAYYIRRVWILSNHNIPLTLFLALVALLRFSFGLTTTSLCYSIGQWTTFRERRLPLITLAGGLSSAAAVDLIVAFSLIWFLEHSRTGFDRSDSRINLLMIYTINTGLITSIVSVVIVVTYASLPSTLIFLGLVEIQSKLYANSFLASLNARTHILNRGNRSHSEYSSGRSHSARVHHAQVPAQISILQETHHAVDEMPMDDFSKPSKNNSLV
ncbi:hypothetical protein GLOTRDRAFT_136687 [Gloeophyllum trabeum ATCC 11539]|uniref:DUF6534 domain-containing protein n=1 Tax=Gloeophyllum trabeum (strain ATCC 11539 / FP-39264 / Madison 617) TaxID=670483 RepID=S7RT22_GLOTA|nr:uncharacterized protein GLOTRDRAFT_136687 [Gloeophyllum trabeum ATCC 11539]EPQ57835.1 hypothetical protein GLOTRDRAFT_136687 [Gloeophyllum trabeum ATCC 11539]